MVSRPYFNKEGRLILGKGQKNLIKKQKRRRFRGASYSTGKSCTECFRLRKKRKKKKKKKKGKKKQLLW